ncbi:hypothetical protein KRMM14A1004_55150 [Krasilnikovia sp. MM14-A1004]
MRLSGSMSKTDTVNLALHEYRWLYKPRARDRSDNLMAWQPSRWSTPVFDMRFSTIHVSGGEPRDIPYAVMRWFMGKVIDEVERGRAAPATSTEGDT